MKVKSRVGAALLRTWSRWFGRPACRRLNNLLINLGASGLGIGEVDARSNGEARLIRHLLQLLPPGTLRPVVWDVGANDGDYSIQICRHVPDAVVHAFEPHPSTYDRLVGRLGPKGVICHHLALGASVASKQLWDYPDGDGSHHATFYPETVTAMSQRKLQPVEVKVSTIDETARAHDIAAIDLLKLDVEGHELACLEGASHLLSRRAIALVQFEFNAMHLQAHVHMDDFSEKLQGFRLYRILQHGLIPLERNDPMLRNLYRAQNILAVRGADSS